MKTALIIALICLIVGLLIIGIGWGLLQKKPTEKNTVKDSVYEYGLDEAPTQIQIITLDSRVEICPTEGDKWKVECKDKEDLYHTVELVDGVLSVKQIGNVRKWYEYIGIFNGFQTLKVTVYLPRAVYESLSIHSTSGSIRVEEGLIFSNASLQNVSGSIHCASSVTGSLNIQNTSGSIFVGGRVGENLNAKNISGSIHVIGGVDGALNVTGGSGYIEIANATPSSASIKNTSGGISLTNVIVGGECRVDNTSGSIELERCDAAAFDVENVSGSVKGSILSGKVFDCRSTSGGVHVPENGDGGTFKARTTSGGIRITVIE